nr:NADH dehydrogenase subunit 2 [Tripetaloceroides tonkinensis]
MNKTPMKMMFMFLMMFSTLISVSSNSWLGVWLGMEINLLSFMPLISSTSNPSTNESAIKYFIVQTMSSVIMIASSMIMLLNHSDYSSSIIMWSLALSILMKMGAAPLHFWLPETMEGMSWNNCIIMMTWQKITPMIVLSYLSFNYWIYMLFTITSALVGAIVGLNQISLRSIMAYSSINHIGWMLTAMQMKMSLWMCYFITYSILTWSISSYFNSTSVFFLNQLYTSYNENYNKLFMITGLLSLGGMPPLTGFMPKWFMILHLASYDFMLIMTILMASSIITIYFYLKIFFSASLISYWENNWMSNHNKHIFKLMQMTLNSVTILGGIITTMMMY